MQQGPTQCSAPSHCPRSGNNGHGPHNPDDPSLLFLPLSLAAKSVISQEWAVLRAGGGIAEGRGRRASALLLLLQWHSHGRRSRVSGVPNFQNFHPITG